MCFYVYVSLNLMAYRIFTYFSVKMKYLVINVLFRSYNFSSINAFITVKIIAALIIALIIFSHICLSSHNHYSNLMYLKMRHWEGQINEYNSCLRNIISLRNNLVNTFLDDLMIRVTLPINIDLDGMENIVKVVSDFSLWIVSNTLNHKQKQLIILFDNRMTLCKSDVNIPSSRMAYWPKNTVIIPERINGIYTCLGTFRLQERK